MTTEDDFQRALDADPLDWQTYLIFADWLQERDDPRAEAYRALGKPHMVRQLKVNRGEVWITMVCPWEFFLTAREAVDLAVSAFIKMTETRKARLSLLA